MTRIKASRTMVEFHETFYKPFKAKKNSEALDGEFQVKPVDDSHETSTRLPDSGPKTHTHGIDLEDSEFGSALTDAGSERSLLEGSQDAQGGELDQSLLSDGDVPITTDIYFGPSGAGTPSTAIENEKSNRGRRNGRKNGHRKKEQDDGDEVNHAPTDLQLDSPNVQESDGDGTVVGVVRAIDADLGDKHRYELTDDAGGRFSIDSETGAVTVADADSLEPGAGYDITVRVTDSGGAFYDETFTLSLQPASDDGSGGAGGINAPTEISLDNQNVAEAAVGAVVGRLSVTDPDAGDSHYYSVDDARFEVVGGQLKLKDDQSLDHEAGDRISLSVAATDQGGLTVSQSFDIAVLDINEAPTAISLDNQNVAEETAGAVVGQVSITDPEAGDSHTYSVDDARFEVVGEQLKLKDDQSLDHEAGDRISLSVAAIDQGGLTVSQSFDIAVLDINEAPTAISLDNQNLAEAAAGAVVGQVSVTNPDAGDTYTYSVDDTRFEVAGGQLKLKDHQSLDHEARDRISLTVTATDQGGLSISQSFDIVVLDMNEAPTDILFGTDVDENAPKDSLIKIAVAVDPDKGDSFTYELLDDADGRFAIDSITGEVTVAKGDLLDHEAAPSHDITILVRDLGGETYWETFTILVNDINESPTGLTLDTDTVPENSLDGFLVGTISVDDWDVGDYHTFELTDDAGGRFGIDRMSGQIRIADGSLLDFEDSASHSIIVKVTDRSGMFYEEGFTITVQDESESVNQAPTSISLDNLDVEENVTGAEIGDLTVADPDLGDLHSFTVDDARFDVVGTTLKLKDGLSLNHEAESELTLNITATDEGGLSWTESFTLAVIDVNEAPTDLTLSENTVAAAGGEGGLVTQFSIEDWTEDGTMTTWGEYLNGVWSRQESGTITSNVPSPGGREGTSLKLYTDNTYEAARVEIEPYNPAVSGGRFYEFHQTYWYKWDMYFDDWDPMLTSAPLGHEEVIMQMKPVHINGLGNPAIDLSIKNGVLTVSIRGDEDVSLPYDRGDEIRNLGVTLEDLNNRWNEFAVRLNFDETGETALLDIYVNGELSYSEAGLPIGFVNPDYAGPVFKLGYYAGARIWEDGVTSRTLYVDNIKVEVEDASLPLDGSYLDHTLVGVVDVADPDNLDIYRFKLLEDANGRFSIGEDTGEIRIVDGTLLNSNSTTSHMVTVEVTDGAGQTYSEDFTIAIQNLEQILGSDVGETIDGTGEAEHIAGEGGSDVLRGNGGNDVLMGGSGADDLDGGGGNDVMVGGAGGDTIDVSDGADVIVYESILDGGDTIQGFSVGAGGDVINLDSLLDGLGVETGDRDARIAIETNGDTHTLTVDTTNDGNFNLTLATIHVIDGGLLSVDQEVAEIVHGTL